MTAVAPVVGHATAPAAPVTNLKPGLVVYAQLPLLPQAEQPQWVWVEMLKIPAENYDTIAHIASGTPWRWILFACGVIFGTTLGTLSGSADAPDAQFNYDVSSIQRDAVYFHVPEDARNGLNTVEPGLCSNKSSSVASPARDEYRDIVIARDITCVCSGVPAYLCDGAHLIPHLKGDEYIDILTKGVITDIDDERNIILLQGTLHKGFGRTFAIMPKPNFAFPAPDGVPKTGPQSWEPHFLDPAPVAIYPTCRVPENRTNWPPELLFNHVYAAAVLHTFACPQDTREALRTLSRRYFGERGPMTSAERYLHDKQKAAKQKSSAQKDERDCRLERRADAAREMESALPQWSMLLPEEMRWAWCDAMSRQREQLVSNARMAQDEAARAASNARVTDWLQS